MSIGALSFTKRWLAANTLALLLGYLLYTPIAHGIGGDHPGGMSAFQILTHSIALAVVAMLLLAGQRLALRPHLAVPMGRVPLAAVAFVALFLAGSNQPWLGGPDWDILFGSVVLGSAAFVGLVPLRRSPWAATFALLGFPIGCLAGQLIIGGIVLATFDEVPDLQSSRLLHSAYWISIGLAMGLIGSAIGGPALRGLLPSSLSGTKAVLERDADVVTSGR
jgi:hypothetical protein